MNIYVMQGLNIVGMIESFQSIIWNNQYYGKSDLELVVPATKNNLDLLKIGSFLVRDFDVDTTLKNVMVIDNLTIETKEDNGYMLTVKGKGLKNILGRRIIWNQLNYENETIENIIRDVIDKNVINPDIEDRKIENFVLGEIKGFDETATLQLFNENIADWLESVCNQYSLGWEVYIKQGQFVFELYKGTDRTYNSENTPVVFSPSYDNLYASTYNNSLENYCNVALIGGEGEGIDKKSAAIGSATGLNRYEGFIDGSSVSSNGEIITLEKYLEMLQAYGEEQIKQYQKTENFEGTIEPYGMFKLNKDYFLGDVVVVKNEKGITSTPRIIEIIYSEDSNGIKIVPTFSNWEVI